MYQGPCINCIKLLKDLDYSIKILDLDSLYHKKIKMFIFKKCYYLNNIKRILNPLSLLLSLFIFSCENAALETEVLVIGGSTSGVAAELSSARQGVFTVLIEEGPWLGGMLTSAGVSGVDGNTKLPSGIWGEFRDSLIQHYGNKKALQTGWVSNHLFEPSVGNRIFQNMVRNEPFLSPK